MSSIQGIPSAGGGGGEAAALYSDSAYTVYTTNGTVALTIPGGTLDADGQILEIVWGWSADNVSAIANGGCSNFPVAQLPPNTGFADGQHTVRFLRTGAASYFYWEYGERVVAATSGLGVDGTSITWASDIVLDVDFTGGTSKPAYVLARRLI